MSIVIKVENLSKLYRLGTIGSRSLKEDLNRSWARMRGKEDPYLKIGQENDRTQKGIGEYVLALKDINFEVKDGQVLGIIGSNGAGKSTLLKVLSRITAPSTGSIKIKGRVASLLEVGTGFHPELTGRENVFLNGAIMGMSKKEIGNKFDEIVDFSGVERYIDTPVKRYSSGMYVRLAFAVAAHLEPEILIVDEVLAVGDAEFQKKCMGKMKDVSENEGRTILFVSHNMNAVNRLCKEGLLMQNGQIAFAGDIQSIVSRHLMGFTQGITSFVSFPMVKDKEVQISEAELVHEDLSRLNSAVNINTNFKLRVIYQVNISIWKLHLTYYIRNNQGDIVYFSDRSDDAGSFMQATPGTYEALIDIPNPLLIPGTYSLTISAGNEDSGKGDYADEALSFEIADIESFRTVPRPGFIYQKAKWNMKKLGNEIHK